MILMIEHDAVVQSAQRLPPLPQSAARLVNLTAAADTDLRAIVQVIEYDPVLTMNLLRMANSIASGSTKRVGSVRDAAVRMGLRTVSSLAVAASVKPLLTATIPGYHIAGADFWRHSLAAASATEVLRSWSKPAVSPLAFTAALLHDIGKLVLGQLLRPPILDLLTRAIAEGHQPTFAAEMEILSMHHGEVGGVVAQHWGLPESVVNGIIHHHDPEACDEAIGSVTCLANCVAHAVTDAVPAGADSMQRSRPPDFVLQTVGISEQEFVDLCRAVASRLAAVAVAYES